MFMGACGRIRQYRAKLYDAPARGTPVIEKVEIRRVRKAEVRRTGFLLELKAEGAVHARAAVLLHGILHWIGGIPAVVVTCRG